MKLSPVHDIALKHNARFAEHNGWQVAMSYSTTEAELRAAREHLALADESACGKLMVEGRAAEQTIKTALGVEGLAVNGGAASGGAFVYRLRADMYFVNTQPGGDAAMHGALLSAVGAGMLVSVTDLTHGLAQLRLIGEHSEWLLRKVSGLDFHPKVFTNGMAKQTSLAKTPQLIVRRDCGTLPAYAIMGARSLAAYVWHTLMEAGEEWHIAAVGAATLQALEA